MSNPYLVGVPKPTCNLTIVNYKLVTITSTHELMMLLNLFATTKQ
jgi:hypothetical protein